MWGAKGTRETKKNSVLTIHGYQKKEKMNFVQYLANLLDVDQISHQNWVWSSSDDPVRRPHPFPSLLQPLPCHFIRKRICFRIVAFMIANIPPGEWSGHERDDFFSAPNSIDSLKQPKMITTTSCHWAKTHRRHRLLTKSMFLTSWNLPRSAVKSFPRLNGLPFQWWAQLSNLPSLRGRTSSRFFKSNALDMADQAKEAQQGRSNWRSIHLTTPSHIRGQNLLLQRRYRRHRAPHQGPPVLSPNGTTSGPLSPMSNLPPMYKPTHSATSLLSPPMIP